MGLDVHYPLILNSLVRNARIKTVLELGVCTGISSEAILRALPGDGKLWSVDILPLVNTRAKLERMFGTKWTFLSPVDDLQLEWDRTVDMVFTDTVHNHDQILQELRKYSPYAERFVVVHDTRSSPSVKEGIQAFLEDDNEWAWAEWEHHHGLAMLMRI